MSLLLIDVDRFKVLNDLRGHQAGDEVLRRLGGILADTVQRPYDVVARYGGEEFAIILPDTDMEGGRAIAESVRRALAAAAMPHPAGLYVSVSIGVACQEGRASAGDKLVAESDTALYEAKRRGGNNVVCHGSHLAQRL